MYTGNKGNIHFQITITPTYFSVLDKMISMIDSENSEEVHLYLPFIITCAATLECMLNEKIIHYSADTFGVELSRKYADHLIAIKLKGKLEIIIPFLSASKNVIRDNTITYQSLNQLISIRNRLMHNKAYYEEYEGIIENRTDIQNIKISVDVKNILIFNLNVEWCHLFYKSLKDFSALIYSDIEKWNGNDIV